MNKRISNILGEYDKVQVGWNYDNDFRLSMKDTKKSMKKFGKYLLKRAKKEGVDKLMKELS